MYVHLQHFIFDYLCNKLQKKLTLLMRVFSNIVFMGVAVKKKTPFWLPLSVSLYFLSLFLKIVKTLLI